MKNIVLTISYDGTGFFGFQKQPHKRTIQGVLEEGLNKLVGKQNKSLKIVGSGRTDSGVHAVGQVVNFFWEYDLPIEAYLKGLNTILPSDLVVKDVTVLPAEFNARRSAVAKEYHYWFRIAPTKSPLGFKALKVNTKPDLSQMEKALQLFLGTHDFAGFRSSGSSVEGSVRTIYDVGCSTLGSYAVFSVVANGFLYNMMRIIMGTVLDVGRGKRAASTISELLKAKDRTKVGPTISPEGLYLYRVYYGNDAFEQPKNLHKGLKCHLDICDYFT